jgi:energy-coupling factor transporter ATP-binding protein EcfA2
MTQISKVTLKRFKRLQEFELDLSETTVLIGANNSGKSSVLQALHFAVAVAQTAKLVGENVRWGADKFKLSFNPTQLLYSPIADVLSLAYGGQLDERLHGQIEFEITLTSGEKCQIAVSRGRNRNIAVSLVGRSVGERLMNLDTPFTIYAPGLAGIAKEERYMSPGAVRRVVARGDANLVLRNVLLMIYESQQQQRTIFLKKIKEEFEKKGLPLAGLPYTNAIRGWTGPWTLFHQDMDALFPGITFEIEFNKERDETINVFFRRTGQPRLPIDAAGTSILQASQILAYITLFRPEVLILDEPDSHLHPDNQRMLCDLIHNLAKNRKFRPLISTHSRHMLDALRDRAQIVWVSAGKKVPYDAASIPSMLLDLGALDTVDYFANGNFTCLFATEDGSASSINALRILLDSNGFPMNKIEIRSYAGCSKIDSAKVLRNFLHDKAPKVSFVLHRDRDYMDDATANKIEESLLEIEAHPFITVPSDIEGYFIEARHISHLNPAVSVERAQELIDAATLATRAKSIKAIINIRTEAALKMRVGGKALDPGALAEQANNDYDADPARWRRGKIVLNELVSLLHKELKKIPVIFQNTEHLRCQKLSEISRKVGQQYIPPEPKALNWPAGFAR